MTTYLRSVLIADGYFGKTQALHLCQDPTGAVWGVWSGGYITFADPAQGIPALPTVEAR